MTKHAFVTGATGFLGVNLVQQLSEQGWEITAIHRNKIDHPLLNKLKINWKNASLFSVKELQNAMPNKPFVVFHLAASTTQFKPEYPMQTKTNVEGTANMLSAIKNKNVEFFVHTSSIAAFGFHGGKTIDETTPMLGLESKHNYSITKLQSEKLVKKAFAETGLKGVVLNPCNIIGPWDTRNWIQLFQLVKAEKVPGIPPASGSYAYVTEVAKAHISAVTKGRTGENYILGGPTLPMIGLINEIERQFGKKISKKTTPAFILKAIEPFYRIQGFITKKEPTLTPDKVKLLIRSYNANDSKARAELDYKHLSLEKIVANTIAWMENKTQ